MKEWIEDMRLFFTTVFSLWKYSKPYRKKSKDESKHLVKTHFKRWWKEERTFWGFVEEMRTLNNEKELFLEDFIKEVESDEVFQDKLKTILIIAGLKRTDGSQLTNEDKARLYMHAVKSGVISTIMLLGVIALILVILR